jgi:hypothetical protein
MEARDMHQHNQFSIRFSNCYSSPNGDWIKDLSIVIAYNEFGAFRENITVMKTIQMPNYYQYHLFKPNDV